MGVRGFAIDRFGWDKSQVGKLLKPVIQALEEIGGSRQIRLEKYFKSHRVKLPDKGLISTSKRVAIRRYSSLLVVNNLKLWFAFQDLNFLRM